MKRILNKWQTHFALRSMIETRERGWKKFEFGIFKIVKFPAQGEVLHKPQYKGMIIKFLIWLPFDRA